MAEPLDGACAVIPCRNTSVILAHTHVGLGGDNDGEQVEAGGFSVIRVNPDLLGGEYLDTVIHEFAHAFFPDLTEDTVKQFATQACGLLLTSEVKRRAGVPEWDDNHVGKCQGLKRTGNKLKVRPADDSGPQRK